MALRISISLFLCLIVSLPTGARELSDLSLEISTAKKGGEAKQDALDQATEDATRRLTEDLLGPEKTAQHWAQIGPKLLKSSTRYVLFIKAGSPVEAGDVTKVPVQLRLAPDNLETLLREMGLFSGGTVRVLPLVTVAEPRGSKYVWWADAGEEKSTLAQEHFKRTFQQMNAQFKGKQIFVLDPTTASFRMGVPPAYRTENIRREDQALLGQYLKADVVLSGRVDVVRARADGPEHRVEYKLQLWQAKNGRGVAEIERADAVTGDNPKVVGQVLDQGGKKTYGELAGKLAEAVGSGSLNLGVLRVMVVGNLNYRQQNDLRRQIGEVREVRALKERLFEPSRVTYEAETQASAGDLAKSLRAARFNGFNVAVESVQDNGLVLSVRATSAQ